MVLGPLAENRLFLSTENYGLAWLARPGVLLLILITLVGAFYPVIKARRRRAKKVLESSASEDTNHGEAVSTRRVTWEMVFSGVVILTLTWALWTSRKFNFRAGLFPWAIGFPVLAFSIVHLISDLKGGGGRGKEASVEETGPEIPTKVVTRRTAGIFGWIVGYFVAIWLLGFNIAGPLCTFVQLKFGSRERWLIILIFTAISWLLIYGLFDRVLHVPFPIGKLLEWF